MKLNPKKPLHTRRRLMWISGGLVALLSAGPDVLLGSLVHHMFDAICIILGLPAFVVSVYVALGEYLSETDDYPPLGIAVSLACLLASMANPVYLLVAAAGGSRPRGHVPVGVFA